MDVLKLKEINMVSFLGVFILVGGYNLGGVDYLIFSIFYLHNIFTRHTSVYIY
jgi:hypothetical protein